MNFTISPSEPLEKYDFVVVFLIGCAITTVFSGRANEIENDRFGGYRINEYNIYLILCTVGMIIGIYGLANIYHLGKAACEARLKPITPQEDKLADRI